MGADILSGGNCLFVDKQTEKRKGQIRSSRQPLIKNPIRVSGCTPAEQESRVNRLRIVCKNNAKITKCPFRITLNQEEVCGLPGNVRCCWVRFHGVFDTLSLLVDPPRNLVGPRQIQPVPRFVRIQMYGCPIIRDSFVQTCAGQCKVSAEQFAIFSVRWFQANGFVEIRYVRSRRKVGSEVCPQSQE